MKKINLVSTALLIIPIAFTLSFSLLYYIHQPIDKNLLLSHVAEFGIQSSRLQLFIFAGLVAAIAAVCVFILLNPQNNFLIAPEPFVISTRVAVVFILTPFLIGEVTKGFATGFFSTLLFVLLTANNFIRRPKPNILFLLFYVLILTYVTVFFVMPLFFPLVVMSGAQFAGVESHYAMTVLPGFDFLCCNETGIVERSNYGLSIFTLTAIAYKILSILGVQDIQLILSVKLYQISAACLLVFAIYLLNKKHFLFISALALAVTPALNTLGPAVYYPNQSGIRYIPFLFGLIFMAWSIRHKNPKILHFALASATLLVMNLETGFALFSGFSVFLVLIKYKPEQAYRTTLKTIGSFSALTFFIFSLLSIFIVQLFYRGTSSGFFSFLELFSSGYGGLVSKPNVFATFIIFFAVVAIFRGVIRTIKGKVTHVDAFQAGIGTMILTWLPYYVNRMAEWNLWFQAALILLLFTPRIRLNSLIIIFRRFSFGTFYITLATSLFGALLFVSAARIVNDSSIYITLAKSLCYKSPVVVNGFCFAGSDGPAISEQVEFLKGLTEKRDYLVLSYMPTQVRLMGFNEGFPWYEPYGEIPRINDFNSLIEWINSKGPQYIVAEDSTSVTSVQMPNRSVHLKHIVDNLLPYRKYKTDSGWIIYKRKSSSPNVATEVTFPLNQSH